MVGQAPGRGDSLPAQKAPHQHSGKWVGRTGPFGQPRGVKSRCLQAAEAYMVGLTAPGRQQQRQCHTPKYMYTACFFALGFQYALHSV